MKNKKSGISKMVAAGAGAAALGAGAYYLMGPKSKAHQKKAKVLMGKVKKEAVKEFNKAKKAGTPMYKKAIKKAEKQIKKSLS